MGHMASAAGALCGLVFSVACQAGTLTPLYTLPGHVDGAYPVAPLVRVGAKLFGVSNAGGASRCGAVFSIDFKSVGKTGRDTTIYSFGCGTDGSSPFAGMTLLGGKLFGTTTKSGAFGGGTVFEIDPTTGLETTLASLPYNSQVSAPLLAYHGLLYGVASNSVKRNQTGSIFTVDPSTKTETEIRAFGQGGGNHPQNPFGALIRSGSKLYGTSLYGGTAAMGTIYRLNPATAAVTTIYSFHGASDGARPAASLVDEGGILYGTTLHGGAANDGVVFSFDTATKTEHTVYAFTGGMDGGVIEAGLVSANGLLYGASQSFGQFGNGTIYSIDPASGLEATVHAFTLTEGSSVQGNLIVNDGTLYGALSQGGPEGQSGPGALFAFDPASAQESTLHIFPQTFPGAASAAIQVGASLYGTSKDGGDLGLGSIYKVERGTGEGQTVFSFTGKSDGLEPAASLIDVGGILYGTTSGGGSGNAGTVFSYDPAARKLITLYAFSGLLDGGNPQASLIASNGLLYGTTLYGGKSRFGTVFSIDPSHGTDTVLHSFGSGDDGRYPTAGLVEEGGLFYGAAGAGGSAKCGMLYSIDPATAQETALYAFQAEEDGCGPETSLLYDNGLLYGQTYGSFNANGTLFSFDTSTGTETVLHRFRLGEAPSGALIVVGKKLYGTIPLSPKSLSGSIVSVNPVNGRIDSLYDFADQADGLNPVAALLHLDGAFYGTAYTNAGHSGPAQPEIFKFVP